MTSDRPALQVREETQSSGLNILDILGDKRALAAGALTAIGVAGVMHLKPEILQSAATDAMDLLKPLRTFKSQVDEVGGMPDSLLHTMLTGVSEPVARLEHDAVGMDMSGSAARFQHAVSDAMRKSGPDHKFDSGIPDSVVTRMPIGAGFSGSPEADQLVARVQHAVEAQNAARRANPGGRLSVFGHPDETSPKPSLEIAFNPSGAISRPDGISQFGVGSPTVRLGARPGTYGSVESDWLVARVLDAVAAKKAAPPGSDLSSIVTDALLTKLAQGRPAELLAKS